MSAMYSPSSTRFSASTRRVFSPSPTITAMTAPLTSVRLCGSRTDVHGLVHLVELQRHVPGLLLVRLCAGVFHPAERRVHGHAGRRLVHLDQAGLHPPGEPEGLRHVARDDAR